jgi:tetratricopeptide (TPR) repeat protein
MPRICFVLSLVFGVHALAFDFTEADKFFAQRENSSANIAKARAIYQRALTQADTQERVYAMGQLGKLAYYEGDLMTPEDEHSRRVSIFQKCQDDVDAISPSKIGRDTGTYHYWRATCIALWGKSASRLSVPFRAGNMRDSMAKGLSVDKTYEGGGTYRLMGAVYVKSKALSYLPGLGDLYNPSKALEYIDEAIRIGPEYHNAYLYRAEVLKELGRKDEGRSYLIAKKNKLAALVSARTLPQGLEPESKLILRQMESALASW